jgi:lipopolysaccharide biosynthesis protein
VIVAENRGRDIAPWLFETRNVQKKYDFFCHIHSKKSPQFSSFSDAWRTYLLDNLLGKEAIYAIAKIFSDNQQVGLVYPPCFKNTYDMLNLSGDGPMQEDDAIYNFLQMLGLPQINARTEVLFCPGTMFWYRPGALHQLFEAHIEYDDFSPEPIGDNGTLAHAIERLPSYIAECNGYVTRLYISSKELVDGYYRSNYPGKQEYPAISQAYQYASKLILIAAHFIPSDSIPRKILSKVYHSLNIFRIHPGRNRA